MNKNTFKTLAVGGLMTVAWSCSDFLEQVNPNQPSDQGFFANEANIQAAVNGAYAALNARTMYQRQLIPMEYMSGDMTRTEGGNNWADNVETFGHTPETSDLINRSWTGMYTGVSRANAAIEIIESASPEIFGEGVQDRLLGEAYFLRGLYYFHIVTYYGEAPLVTESVKSLTDEIAFPTKSGTDLIWAQVESDFTEAARLLPKFEDYTGADELIGRASKGAAQGYLGKALLYQGKWSEAETAFGLLVNSPEVYGAYSLVANYEDNFGEANENNAESLFEVQFMNSGANLWVGDDIEQSVENGTWGMHLNPVQGFGNGFPSDELNQFFDDNQTGTDVRRFHTIVRVGEAWLDGNPFAVDPEGNIGKAGGTSGIRKWASLSDACCNGGSGVNQRLMRFADVLLMYAEALNENGNTAAAITEIEKVRSRAGADPLTVSTQADVRDAIKAERRLELSFEYSRFFDVVRWGDAQAVYGPKGFVVGKHETLPIPASELQANPNLAQDAAWLN